MCTCCIVCKAPFRRRGDAIWVNNAGTARGRCGRQGQAAGAPNPNPLACCMCLQGPLIPLPRAVSVIAHVTAHVPDEELMQVRTVAGF